MAPSFHGVMALVAVTASLLPLSLKEAHAATCTALLPSSREASARRGVTVDDLIELRDIGPIASADKTRDMLSLSSDGKWIAFQLRQADPVANIYCLGMTIIPARGGAPHVVDTGGDLIIHKVRSYGWAGLPSGVPSAVTPRWSPDNRWIAYLKRTNGSIQVWRAEIDGPAGSAVTHSPSDVEDFRLTDDGQTLVYKTRRQILDVEAAIAGEGQSRGWRLDNRAYPIRGARPQTPDSTPAEYFRVDIATGMEESASNVEISLFNDFGNGHPDVLTTRSGNGNVAWGEIVHRSTSYATLKLIARTQDGSQFICDVEACRLDSRSSLFWNAAGTHLRFTRREGWSDSLTSIYEWRLGARSPRLLYSTSDLLVECHSLVNDLICLRERALNPRHIVRLNVAKRKQTILFDPNPIFRTLTMGKVERLHWRTDAGIACYGDLVYPVGYQAGKQYPLIITQYRTRGFLRGGTGDEVPIQAFANRGFMILSVENLEYEAVVGQRATPEEELAAFTNDFIGRKAQLAEIETITNMLIARGLIDAQRVGITGLSDGSTTVQFAAVNSSMFAAASLGGCCWEPAQDGLLGPLVADRYHRAGWPSLLQASHPYWKAISFTQNAARVKIPLLFQVADGEFLGAVESFTALAQAGTPVDMFIFPDEFHVKWQPAHRLAMYKRNMAWFDFWLNGWVPSDPLQRKEALNWEALRLKASRSLPSGHNAP